MTPSPGRPAGRPTPPTLPPPVSATGSDTGDEAAARAAGGASGPAPVALSAQSLHRFFRVGDQETLALQGVSLQVSAGELVAVTGPSGSGKSTLLACLAGLEEPDAGTVTVVGHRMSGRSEPERARLRARHIGVLLQSGNLIEHLSVAQNVALVQQLVRQLPDRPVRSDPAVGHDPATLLDTVGLASRAGAYPSRLSGGETARAGLAVALANDPPVLLADEPTGELDSTTGDKVLALLRQAAARGTGVLVASHDPAVAAAADRRLALLDGRVAS